MTASLRSRPLLWLLLGCDAAVVLAFVYFLSPLWPWGPSHVHVLDPNGEANLPTWYSSSKLLLAGVVLAGRALRFQSSVMAACAALAVGMSADESANLHELAGFLLSHHLPPHWQLFGDPSVHMWPYVYGLPAVLVVALGLWWLISRDQAVSPVTTTRLLGAFLLFFSGAVAMELVQHWWPANLLPVVFGQVSLLMLLEESMENVGASVLLWAAVQASGSKP